MARGLLDRLACEYRDVDEVTSVVAHLHALLNTRKGESLTAPGFGVTDLTDVLLSLPNGMAGLERELRATIEAWEPRLSHVRVRHVPGVDALRLHFEITARLARDRRTVLRVTTELDGTGHFHVSE